MLSGPGQQIFLSFFLSVWFLKNSGEKKEEMQSSFGKPISVFVFKNCFREQK
jgi:hypothetical protein